jgi:transcriptional regulator with XRE-family HTH domain
VATRQRPADRGAENGRRLVFSLGNETRIARRDRGLSLRAVAAAVGVSPATIWRIENGVSPNLSIILLARLLAVVGLDLSARAFPGPDIVRDMAHAVLLARFRTFLHPSLRWSSEVPLPLLGDRRRWDGMVQGPHWRYGTEAETGPQDGQALAGRLQLKARDGDVNGVLLVLPATRRVRSFLAAVDGLFEPQFPVPGRVALERLGAGLDPGGSAIVVVRPMARVSPAEPRRT